ncbi:MAG: aldo/keto reductase [Acidiferrobacteraceae bacterium]
MSAAWIEGGAEAAGTAAYVRKMGAAVAEGHYSDFLDTGLKLSSIGIGTFPGIAADEVDRHIASTVARGLGHGLNLIDTATHYRYGRSARAVGEGVRLALTQGVPRNAMFLISKGGFLRFSNGRPDDVERWFQQEIADRGFGTREELAGIHLITPAHLRHQIDISRAAIGVATLDAFLIDQPEVQIPVVGKQELIRRLDSAFVALEQAVQDGLIRWYGVSSFESFRVPQDHRLFLSLASLEALAEQAVKRVFGERVRHHFAIIELPFNAVMPEGFTRFNQVTGQGNEASTLQAALQCGVFTIASHTLFKGHLARISIDVLEQAMPRLAPAQRALQFNRSTPGLGATLAGISTPAHLDDALNVVRQPLMPRDAYLSMFQKAE